MHPRSRRRVAVASALAAVCLVAWFAFHDRAAVRAGRLVAEAQAVVDDARKGKLVPLASEAFALAEGDIARARELLARGSGRAALPVAATALSEAQAALAKARGQVSVAQSATLAALRNEVLYRPAAGLAWSDAVKGMDLYDNDRVQTKQSAEALVRFEAGNEMRVDENSVVVVQRPVENRLDQEINMEMAVSEGKVRSVVTRDGGRDVRLSLRLPNGRIDVDTAKVPGGEAEVGTEVMHDASVRVAVYRGQARLTTDAGENLVIDRDQYTEMSPQGKLAQLKQLPHVATALAPDDGRIVLVNPNRPGVTFLWQNQGTCVGSRLEVADEPGFANKILDETTPATRVTAKDLKDGSYAWRVSCIEASGMQGPYSETRRFTLARDGEAPSIIVVSPLPRSVVASEKLDVRCRSEDGASVFINGEPARADGRGEFVRSVTLVPGLNRIEIEALDPAGNATHLTSYVTYQIQLGQR